MGSSLSVPNPNDPSVQKQSYAVDDGDWGSAPHRVASRKGEARLLGVEGPYLGTLYDNFRSTATKTPELPCLGTRVFKADGTRGEYRFISYRTVSEKMTLLGSAFRKLGIEAGHKVGIYSINRAEWVITEQACNAYNLVTVALYDTLGASAVRYILNHAEIPLAVISLDKLKALLDACRDGDGVPSLKYIVTFEKPDDESRAAVVSLGKTILSFEEAEKMGTEHPAPHDPPKPDDLAIIMYTSGTTGDPKGVMLTHSNFMSTVNAVLYHGVALQSDDVHFSFLPLAHSFERSVQATVYRVGGSVGFYQGSIPKMVEDIGALRPTIFCGVPRVFNRFYDKVLNTVNAAGGVKASLFHHAYAARLAALKSGQDTPFWNRTVFDKLKLLLGGRVRYMLTGSAPIDSKVLEFLRVCFCPVVMQGYGLTETCAASAVTMYNDVSLGRVGPPLACNEYKLVDARHELFYDGQAVPSWRAVDSRHQRLQGILQDGGQDAR
eukprot:Opistho-2@48326